MAWKVALKFSDGDIMELDDSFDSEDEAYDAAQEAISNYYQGNSVLDMAGEDYSSDTVKGYKVFYER